MKLEQPMMSVSRKDDNTWSTSNEKSEPLTPEQSQMANELDDYTDTTYGVRGTQQIPKGNPNKYFMGGLTLAKAKADEKGMDSMVRNAGRGMDWFNTVLSQTPKYVPKLKKAVEDENLDLIEETVEEHPDEVKPIVEDTPLETEIEQMDDGDKRTDEVNNEAVEQSIPELEDKLETTDNQAFKDIESKPYYNDLIYATEDSPEFLNSLSQFKQDYDKEEVNKFLNDNGLERLIDAIQEGDNEAVEEIVEEHPDEVKPIVEDTPLETEIEQMDDGDKRTDEVNNEAVQETIQGFDTDKFLNEMESQEDLDNQVPNETPKENRDELKIQGIQSEDDIDKLKFRSKDMKFAKDVLSSLDEVSPEVAQKVRDSGAINDPEFWDKVAREFYNTPDKVKHVDNSLKNKIDSARTGRAHRDYQPRYTDVEKAFQSGGKEGMYSHVLDKALKDYTPPISNNIGMLGGEVTPTPVDSGNVEIQQTVTNETVAQLQDVVDIPEEIATDLQQEPEVVEAISEMYGINYHQELIDKYESKIHDLEQEILTFKLGFNGTKEELGKNRKLQELNDQLEHAKAWLENLKISAQDPWEYDKVDEMNIDSDYEYEAEPYQWEEEEAVPDLVTEDEIATNQDDIATNEDATDDTTITTEPTSPEAELDFIGNKKEYNRLSKHLRTLNNKLEIQDTKCNQLKERLDNDPNNVNLKDYYVRELQKGEQIRQEIDETAQEFNKQNIWKLKEEAEQETDPEIKERKTRVMNWLKNWSMNGIPGRPASGSFSPDEWNSSRLSRAGGSVLSRVGSLSVTGGSTSASRMGGGSNTKSDNGSVSSLPMRAPLPTSVVKDNDGKAVNVSPKRAMSNGSFGSSTVQGGLFNKRKGSSSLNSKGTKLPSGGGKTSKPAAFKPTKVEQENLQITSLKEQILAASSSWVTNEDGMKDSQDKLDIRLLVSPEREVFVGVTGTPKLETIIEKDPSIISVIQRSLK